MGDVVLFRLGRSPGLVAAFASALAAHEASDSEGIAATWRRDARALAVQVFDHVPTEVLNQELYRLMGAAAAAADTLRTEKAKHAAKKRRSLRVVARRPEQLDLFDAKPEPAKSPAPISGGISHVG